VSAQEAGGALILALVMAGTFALLRSLIPGPHADRKVWFEHFRHCFVDYSFPGWCVSETHLMVGTGRWVP
jgi:hypothetical protein